MEYTIGELAARAGVATHVLRHWEDEGLLSPDRRVAGRRVYGPAGVNRVAEIHDDHRSCPQFRSMLLSRLDGVPLAKALDHP